MDYDKVALILSQILNKSKSFKNAVYSNTSAKNLTSTYALVCETLKRVALLRSLLSDSNLFPKSESQQLTETLEESEHFSNKLSTDDCLYLVIAYEILFGHSNQVADAFPTHPVVTSRVKLASLLTKKQGNFPAECNSSKPALVPKYVKINGLKISFTSVSKTLINLGFEQIPLPVCDSPSNSEHLQNSSMICQVNRQKYRRLVSRLKPKQFIADADFQNDMLVFNSRADLHNLELYENGQILIQDKASSLPARVLLRPASATEASPDAHAVHPHPVVIDACAAPGNKSVQLAELMDNAGTLFTFDRDPSRFAMLSEQLEKHYVANSRALCADFLCIPSTAAAAAEAAHKGALNLSAEQLELCARADYILVDPSCSGSGIVTRLDSIIDGAVGESETAHACRLRRLSGFQLRLVLHALSFERVRRVVYSTCSAFREENDCVVLDALLRSESGTRFALVRPTDPSFAPFLSPLRALPPPLPVAPQPLSKRKRPNVGQEQDVSNTAPESSSCEHALSPATLASLCCDADGRQRALDLVASYCLHASPALHLTNGFFVACFERVTPIDA